MSSVLGPFPHLYLAILGHLDCCAKIATPDLCMLDLHPTFSLFQSQCGVLRVLLLVFGGVSLLRREQSWGLTQARGSSFCLRGSSSAMPSHWALLRVQYGGVRCSAHSVRGRSEALRLGTGDRTARQGREGTGAPH